MFFIKGCFANKLVLKPIFSAFANASSVVPVLSHSNLNFLNSLVFLKLSLSGWSIERAIKLAPKIVSGRVVKTLIFLLKPSTSKLSSQPKIFQSSFFALVSLFLANLEVFLNHLKVLLKT